MKITLIFSDRNDLRRFRILTKKQYANIVFTKDNESDKDKLEALPKIKDRRLITIFRTYMRTHEWLNEK